MKVCPRKQDEEKSNEGEQSGNWIQRHSIATNFAFTLVLRQEYSDALEQKLKEYADDYKRRDDLLQAEDTADHRDRSQPEERMVRYAKPGMDCTEPAREVAVSRCGEWDSRLPEKQGKDGAERCNGDQHHDYTGGAVAVEALHKYRNGEHARMAVGALLSNLAPWENTEHANVHEQV